MHPNVQQVLSDAPDIHGGEGSADLVTYGLTPTALNYIAGLATPGSATLETGSGFSTIVLAMSGARHTCIVPNQQEIDRIIAYCEGRGISTSACTFIAKPSERALPALDLDPLDLVLIDGSHSFPQVFIDWFYVADALRVGGTVLLDDIHVWTGRVLRDFLVAEPSWELVRELEGRTSVFEKRAEVDPDKVWFEQPYVVRHSRLKTVARARMAASMLRNGEHRQLARVTREMLSRG